MEKLVLIDGHSILNRAFYGVPDLTNPEGLHTNAVYGFLNIMFKILDEEKADHLAVAFDLKEPTFRHKMYEAYKGTRKPMPQELAEQVPLIKEVLSAMQIPILTLAGYEADDILGTVAKQCQASGKEVSIISGDRDLLQLSDEKIKIRIPKTSRGNTQVYDYYPEDVKREYQVTPVEYIDVKALMGDASDNIPGVPSIGEKTATAIIAAYGSIENAYAHLEEIKPPRAKKALGEHYDMAQMSKTLATICIDCGIGFSYEDAKIENLYTPEAYQCMARLGFKSLLSRFGAAAVEEDTRLEDSFTVTDSKEEAKVWIEKARKAARDGRVGLQILTCKKEAAVEQLAFSFDPSGQMTFGGMRDSGGKSAGAVDQGANGGSSEAVSGSVAEISGTGKAGTVLAADKGAGTAGADEESAGAGVAGNASGQTARPWILDPDRSWRVTGAALSLGKETVCIKTGDEVTEEWLAGSLRQLILEAGAGAIQGDEATYGARSASAEEAGSDAAHGAGAVSVQEARTGSMCDAGSGAVCETVTVTRSGGSHIWVPDLKSLLPVLDLDYGAAVLDGGVAAYLLDPLKASYGYDDLARDYLGLTLPSEKELFGKLPAGKALGDGDEKAAVCACYMACAVCRAAEKLETRLKETGMWELYLTIEMPLIYSLYHMETAGVKVRRAALKEYGDKLKVQIGELEEQIYADCGQVFNINSPKQLGEILFEKMQLKGGKKTKTGYSTAADVLEKLAPEVPVVQKILDYRQLTKLNSTYAEGLAVFIGENERIHGTFNQTITATGRISSTEPNLQNIPVRMELGREIRKVFVPEEGYVFVDADYSQIELRILASLSGDQRLIEAYGQAQDIHAITASQVFHIPLEEVTPLQRRNAKAVNFGIVYGISAFGLGEDLSVSRKEAQEYIDLYFQTYPGVKAYLDQLVAEGKEKGYVRTLYGRRRPIPELKSSNFMQRSFGERVAMNSPIQGTAADVMKIAMIGVDQELEKRGLRSRIVLQVHDELLIETWKEETQIVKEILEDKMKHAAELKVALEVEAKEGDSWFAAK